MQRTKIRDWKILRKTEEKVMSQGRKLRKCLKKDEVTQSIKRCYKIWRTKK